MSAKDREIREAAPAISLAAAAADVLAAWSTWPSWSRTDSRAPSIACAPEASNSTIQLARGVLSAMLYVALVNRLAAPGADSRVAQRLDDP